MNKRIKNKVTKRIINKMQTKNKLTDFEKRFFDKYLIDSFSDIATEFLDNFLLVISRWLDTEIEKVEEQIAELDAAKENAVEQSEWLGGIDLNQLNEVKSEVSSASSAPNQARESIGLDRIGAKEFNSLYISKQNVVEIKEPNKWNKLKVKAKGWFGK